MPLSDDEFELAAWDIFPAAQVLPLSIIAPGAASSESYAAIQREYLELRAHPIPTAESEARAWQLLGILQTMSLDEGRRAEAASQAGQLQQLKLDLEHFVRLYRALEQRTSEMKNTQNELEKKILQLQRTNRDLRSENLRLKKEKLEARLSELPVFFPPKTPAASSSPPADLPSGRLCDDF